MSDTRLLLGRIAALRKRLEQTESLAEGQTGLTDVVNRVAEGATHDTLVDIAVSPATMLVEQQTVARPRQLTARARRVLERGRELLGRLRILADAFGPFVADDDESIDPVLLDRSDPLAILYRETAAMTDAAVRLVAFFPDTATAQMKMCEGLEAILSVVDRRTETLHAGVEQHRAEFDRVTRLATLLSDLDAGRPVGLEAFVALAGEILTEAEECFPLRFHDADLAQPRHFVARHSLNVARVATRLGRHDADLRARPLDAVLAALLHDVGMLRVSSDLISQSGSFDDASRREVEVHCRAGAEILTALAPEAPWLANVALTHHERLDGTGYPDGLREPQLISLSRLIAVCDTYAALCSARPHRLARDPRTALTDTLLLAEQGRLDGKHAEGLLNLSFYPAGTAVELADGSLGVVVAASEPTDPSRPIVALLMNGQGEPLPLPRYLHLARCDSHSIVRALPAAERRAALGREFPEWA